MPLPMINFPTISFDQANPFLTGVGKSMNIGNAYNQMISQQLANQKAQQLLPFVTPEAQQHLIASQLQNKWNPQIWQSEIGLRGAQGQQASSQAAINQYEVQNPQYLNLGAYAYSNNPNNNQQVNNPGTMASTIAENNINNDDNNLGDYGIPKPQLSSSATNPAIGSVLPPTLQDKGANDWYYNQVGNQRDLYNKLSEDANQGADSAIKFKQNLDVFDKAMDETALSGQVKGHIYPFSNSAQTSDTAAAYLLESGMGDIRSIVGRGSWSDNDTRVAQTVTPSRLQNPQTRKLYTSWLRGVADRKIDNQQLINYAKNPINKIAAQDASRINTLYNLQNPIMSDDGKTVNIKPIAPLSSYLTKKALESIRKTGNYIPPEIIARDKSKKLQNILNTNTTNSQPVITMIRVRGKLVPQS